MRRRSRRRWLVEALVGLAMLPLSAVPIWLYVTRTDDGYLMYLRGRYALAAPGTPALDDAQLEIALEARRRLREIRGIPVLVYHGIGKSGTDTADERFVISRERFAEQMRTLRWAGYEPVTTEQLALYLTSDPADEDLPAEEVLGLPERPVLVTFDDGRADALIQADPILRDTGMRATMFVIGKKAEGGSFYYEDIGQLAERAGSGRWELANHTYDLHELETATGSSLSALVSLAPGESLLAYRRGVAADLDRAQRLLEERGGRHPVAFAYPFGDWGALAPPGAAEALAGVLEQRFAVAFDQDDQEAWRPALPGDDRLHIHRLQMMDWSGAELLARLERGAALAGAVYEERGLGYRYSELELAYAAARTVCVEPPDEPVLRRDDLGSERLIALTFNGGPSVFTPQILDVLGGYDAAATFFVTGEEADGHERLLRRMLVEGSELAVAGEIEGTREAIAEATGDEPCLFRPAFGSGAEAAAEAAAERGLTTVLWSLDPQDYAAQTPEEVAAAVIEAASSGDVVLLHDGGDDRRWLTVQALPRILEGLLARGYRLVTVSELLGFEEPGEPEACAPSCPKRGGPPSSGLQEDADFVLASYTGPEQGESAGAGASSAGGSGPARRRPRSGSPPGTAVPPPAEGPSEANPPEDSSPPPDGPPQKPAPPSNDPPPASSPAPSPGSGGGSSPPASSPAEPPEGDGGGGSGGDSGSSGDSGGSSGSSGGGSGGSSGQGGVPPGQAKKDEEPGKGSGKK